MLAAAPPELTRPRADDDFLTIRARLKKLRRENVEVPTGMP